MDTNNFMTPDDEYIQSIPHDRFYLDEVNLSGYNF